jgi:RHS repeat-associated protein
VTAAVNITQGMQTISVFYPNSSLAAGATVQLTATGGGSPNLVTFTSGSTSICTVGASTAGANSTSVASLSVLAAGDCLLTANQAGDALYLAAAPVSLTLTIGAGSQIFYVHTDHLGTPRAITQATGNGKVWEWKNDDPFGANMQDENPSGIAGNFKYNLRFPGQYYDQETGTYYNYFRDYDPSVGRYVQSDPIGLRGGINTFGYVEGAPLSLVDPLGLSSKARVMVLLAQGNLAEATVIAQALGLAIAPRLVQTQSTIQSLINRHPLTSNRCEQLASGISEALKATGRVSPQMFRVEPTMTRYVRIGENGTYAPLNHVYVRVGDRVYDASTGAQGMLYSEYITILNQINNGPASYVIKPFVGK